MLIVALVLAVIGLAALVTAVVTSNELIAWVCIAASSVGVLLLIVDAIRERQIKRVRPAVAAAEDDDVTGDVTDDVTDEVTEVFADDEPAADEIFSDEIREEDHPEELVHDEPDYDTYSDDEPEYPESAEESALHTVRDVEAEESEKSQG